MTDAFWIAFFAFLSAITLAFIPIITLLINIRKEQKVSKENQKIIADKAIVIEDKAKVIVEKQDVLEQKQEVVHNLVNSRMDEMLKITKKNSRAIGVAAGRIAGKAEEKRKVATPTRKTKK